LSPRTSPITSTPYIALDVDEEPAVDVVNKVGPEYFVVSSDYPHSDGAFLRRSSNSSACH